MERLTEKQSAGYDLKAMNGDYCEAYCRQQNYNSCRECGIYEAIQKLAEYEDLEEQYGLPKFHIGQVVYSINFMNEIEEERVSMITQKADRSFKYRLSSGGSVWEATEEKAGRLFFLTREEAEARLKELAGE